MGVLRAHADSKFQHAVTRVHTFACSSAASQAMFLDMMRKEEQRQREVEDWQLGGQTDVSAHAPRLTSSTKHVLHHHQNPSQGEGSPR